jgi:hypothetical protein
MTKYVAPIDEVNFVLTHLCRIDELQKLPGFEDATPDIISAILEEAGKFAQEELADLNWSGDQSGVKIKNKLTTNLLRVVGSVLLNHKITVVKVYRLRCTWPRANFGIAPI